MCWSTIISDKFDKYDPRDIKRFDEDDAYTRLFLRTLASKGDPEKSLSTVHESLSFRKEWGINGIYVVTSVTIYCVMSETWP